MHRHNPGNKGNNRHKICQYMQPFSGETGGGAEVRCCSNCSIRTNNGINNGRWTQPSGTQCLEGKGGWAIGHRKSFGRRRLNRNTNIQPGNNVNMRQRVKSAAAMKTETALGTRTARVRGHRGGEQIERSRWKAKATQKSQTRKKNVNRLKQTEGQPMTQLQNQRV